MKIEIIPAILPKDYAEVEDKVNMIKDFVKTVQIDVCDGQFVPSATWPYKKRDDSFESIVKEERGLPGWEKLNFEIDLMANRPDERVDEWVSAGATRIIIHAEADLKGTIEQFNKGTKEQRNDLISGGRGHGVSERVIKAIDMLVGRVEIALALNIETPISVIDPFKDKIQSVQLMGIDHIGFQGQEFDAKVIDKIEEVRMLYPDMTISVDGGVSLQNAQQLYDAGATRLVVGSGIFNADNYLEALQQLKAVGR
jgi:ribulose-phosphate 3-epimerase